MPSAGGRVRLSAGPLAALHPHAEGVSNPLRSLLEEPRPSAPPVRVWRDWALLAVVTVSGVLEGVLREDLPLPGLSVVLTVGLAPLLLWRRTHPLAVVATAFGVAAVVDIGLIVADAPALEMHSMVYFLVFPYAPFRWGSGREAAAGLAIILVAATLEFFVNWTGVAIGGGAVLMSAFALGLAVRSQHGARQRRWEQVKSEERVLLARELHDTVAHHVSAIAVQAQAALIRRRVQIVNRLQALLAELLPGQVKKDITPMQAKAMLASVRHRDIAGRTRRRIAAEELAELVAVDLKIKKATAELKAMVLTRDSRLMNIHGVGPVVAARILADVGDVARFADRNRFASWTGTAPLDASSGEQNRHRLSRGGNRRINHMIHIAAVT